MHRLFVRLYDEMEATLHQAIIKPSDDKISEAVKHANIL